MGKLRWVVSIVLLTSVPGILPAEVYEWVDGNGRSHYSDRPHENARTLDIAPAITYYTVEKVFDGDTILLSDGRKIRFLGINTPEVAGRHKAQEVGGEQAKAWLRQRLEGKKVRLEFDVEKADQYQRTLAYVFAEDRSQVNLELVERGLATANIYPPNLRYLDRLLKAQATAEAAKLGIWAAADYAAIAYRNIDENNYHGWKRVLGRVSGLKQTAKYSYLQFSTDFALQIDNQWLELFPDLQGYVGKQIEARGWINKRKQQFTLRVRHPADIKILQ